MPQPAGRGVDPKVPPSMPDEDLVNALSQYLEFSEECWINAIASSVPPVTIHANLEAFQQGAGWRRARERAVLAF